MESVDDQGGELVTKGLSAGNAPVATVDGVGIPVAPRRVKKTGRGRILKLVSWVRRVGISSPVKLFPRLRLRRVRRLLRLSFRKVWWSSGSGHIPSGWKFGRKFTRPKHSGPKCPPKTGEWLLKASSLREVPRSEFHKLDNGQFLTLIWSDLQEIEAETELCWKENSLFLAQILMDIPSGLSIKCDCITSVQCLVDIVAIRSALLRADERQAPPPPQAVPVFMTQEQNGGQLLHQPPQRPQVGASHKMTKSLLQDAHNMYESTSGSSLLERAIDAEIRCLQLKAEVVQALLVEYIYEFRVDRELARES
ncbi:hypothetical protein R1sor_018847 [Riccia sorocarpa]|uniref:Uncharacterized protein n=1 Tax=Riccia sorocarpa TaxID=122646 RepID=A0ABD3IEG4_9MARC